MPLLMPLVVFMLNQISTMPLVNFQTPFGLYQVFGNNKTCDLLFSNVELTTKKFPTTRGHNEPVHHPLDARYFSVVGEPQLW
jgi:hypothetical protein